MTAIAATVIWLGPLPPRVVVMSTGTAGSDYDLLGQRYRTLLRRSGIDLRLMPSAGGVENLQRLNDPRSNIAVAFAQGGLTNDVRSPGVQSLGTMFYEPLWFFSRVSVGARLEGLRDKQVSIGPPGSGTRVLALRFLALNGIDAGFATWLPLSAEQAGDALLRGQIDAAAIVTSWDSPVVRGLLASSAVNVTDFPRADAYVALYPIFSKLTLPTGVGNLATNRPTSDVNLLAVKASLLVRASLHPAIQYLLLEAAADIHSTPNIFQHTADFPAAQGGDVPLSKYARQYYKSGSPFLQRYLPFWLAALVSQLLLLLIPILGIAYPLVRFAPTLYASVMQRRIYRLYGELSLIEAELDRGASTGDVLTRLQRLEDRADHMRAPIMYAHRLYTLRSHIKLVQSRVQANLA